MDEIQQQAIQLLKQSNYSEQLKGLFAQLGFDKVSKVLFNYMRWRINRDETNYIRGEHIVEIQVENGYWILLNLSTSEDETVWFDVRISAYKTPKDVYLTSYKITESEDYNLIIVAQSREFRPINQCIKSLLCT